MTGQSAVIIRPRSLVHARLFPPPVGGEMCVCAPSTVNSVQKQTDAARLNGIDLNVTFVFPPKRDAAAIHLPPPPRSSEKKAGAEPVLRRGTTELNITNSHVEIRFNPSSFSDVQASLWTQRVLQVNQRCCCCCWIKHGLYVKMDDIRAPQK